MLTITKVISTELNSISQRLIKVLGFGKNDIQKPIQASPFGDDSNPIKGMVAIYGDTNDLGEKVIIGYLNKDQLAEPGEKRLYSVNSNGTVQAYAWLKANGDIHLNGDTDNAVRWAALNTQLQNQVTALNTEYSKIAAAINAIIPGLYIPAPITLNINSAKIDDIKTT
jgi:hypothetical protein